jgi:hypothetical protein
MAWMLPGSVKSAVRAPGVGLTTVTTSALLLVADPHAGLSPVAVRRPSRPQGRSGVPSYASRRLGV